MSENSTPEERTEMPTARRMEQLRKKGALHHSVEIEQTLTLLSGFLLLGLISPWLFDVCKVVFIRSFQLIANNEPMTTASLKEGFIALIKLVAPPIFVLTLAVAVVATLAVMIQTNWNLKDKIIHFNFSQMHPVNGIKRVFSLQGIVNTLKAIVKLSIMLPIGYYSLKEWAPSMVQLMHMHINQLFVFSTEAMHALFWKILYIMIAIAIFDYVYGKWNWLRQNKMTKEEVKDERKSIDGDEETKREIRRKGMSRIWQRIKEAVPTADVVVTNPTHYAVALRYDRNTMAAPTVVAKGKNFLALRIREIARQNGIPVLERKPLARALYASVEVGSTIPKDLFRAVAEVLAYVYRIRGGRRTQNVSVRR